jgi:hypothetical protein
MAKKRRKKLTKAEAGRLGGKATVRKYGPEHMRKIGKAGFAGLRKKLGYMGGAGLGAIQWLQRQGKFPRPTPEQTAADQQWFEETMEQLLGRIEEGPKP